MLQLRRCILLARLLSSPSASPLHRLLSVAAPAVSPNPGFAPEEFLVDTCGLSRAQALKASSKLTHLKSPSNPDAVLSFLAGFGFSSADIAALVAKDPLFLCTSVERTLAPIAVGLTGLGLSRPEIVRLSMASPLSFRCRSILSNLPYNLLLYGSYENILRAIKKSPSLLLCSLDKFVKPKVAFLRECGLDAPDIAKLCIAHPWLLTTNLERVQGMVACAEALGVPRGSRMFRLALQAVAFRSEDKIAVKVEHLKNMFRWSDAEVRIAVSKFPMVLALSKDLLQRKSEFLISEVGLEPVYFAHRPIVISFSLEGRLRPRYYVLKFLKENGLLDHGRDYYTAVVLVEKVFLEKHIRPYEEAAPYLAEDYEAACRGEMPTRFRFT